MSQMKQVIVITCHALLRPRARHAPTILTRLSANLYAHGCFYLDPHFQPQPSSSSSPRMTS